MQTKKLKETIKNLKNYETLTKEEKNETTQNVIKFFAEKTAEERKEIYAKMEMTKEQIEITEKAVFFHILMNNKKVNKVICDFLAKKIYKDLKK